MRRTTTGRIAGALVVATFIFAATAGDAAWTSSVLVLLQSAAFVADLKDLDAPNTAGGTQAKQAVTSLTKALQEDLAAVEKALSGVSGIKDLPGAVSSIGTVAATAKIQVTSTVSDLQNLPKGELQDAFKNSSACKSVSSST